MKHRTRFAGLGIGLLAAAIIATPAAAVPGIDQAAVATKQFGNDAPWYQNRIPYFESSDTRLDDVYYYRWKLFRAHQRDLGEKGFISTEFLDDVSWQLEPWASLNDASGFHIGEGRWLRDPRYVDDYLAFMYDGGNDRHFTDYMADSAWGRYLVGGDRVAVTRFLPKMQALFAAWNDHYDPAKGLYWTEPLLDATEYTISSIDASGGLDGFFGGNAFRPSINAYMFANARAIARIAALKGEPASVVRRYDDLARTLQRRVEEGLWNDRFGHYVDRHQTTNAHVRYWEPIRGRELVGYLPWTFDMAPDTPDRAGAWQHLLASDRLGGAAGMRTVEPSYPYYMHQFRYDGGGWSGGLPECQWNGPIWPFQTTQVLTGMANLLDHYRQSIVSRGDYMRLLRQYADLHYQGKHLDLEENYHPDTGRPIVGIGRSHHYFHSGFIDLVMTGLVGIRPRADDVLEVNPLLPAASDPNGLRWFRMQDVAYHGRRVAVTWDVDGTHYGMRGLSVEVDGKEVARSPSLTRIRVPLPPVTPAPPAAGKAAVAQSIQLRSDAFPRGSASSMEDAANVHDAIDGRVWFFPELGNGWSSEPGKPDQWYAIDFGKPVSIDRAELAFFADGGRFAAPERYNLQIWRDGGWQDVAARADRPIANGITNARWPAVTTQRIRVTLRQPANRAMRLVEFKVF